MGSQRLLRKLGSNSWSYLPSFVGGHNIHALHLLLTKYIILWRDSILNHLDGDGKVSFPYPQSVRYGSLFCSFPAHVSPWPSRPREDTRKGWGSQRSLLLALVYVPIKVAVDFALPEISTRQRSSV